MPLTPNIAPPVIKTGHNFLNMPTRYHIIKNKSELSQLIDACKETGIAAVDFETNAKGIYTKDFIPTILSVSFQAGSGICIPLQHFQSKFRKKNLWLKMLRKFGREVVENPNITKVAQNWKFDNQVFVKYGIYSRGTVIDTMLAKYLLNEERPHDLGSITATYLPEFAGYKKRDEFEKIKDWGKKELEPLSEYGCLDTDMTLRLGIFLESKLIQTGLYNLYRNLIMPASNVLQHAEARGLLLDVEFNAYLHTKYEGLIKEATSEIMSLKVVRKYEKKLHRIRVDKYIEKLYTEIAELEKSDKNTAPRGIKGREEKISRILAGEYNTKAEKALVEPLNLGSQKQLVGLMYTDPKGLKFPILRYTKDKKTKKPTNNPSTDEDTLLELRAMGDKGGFLEALLKLRGYKQNYSTFIKGYKELPQDGNYIHPKFNLHGTVTGRLSSSDPNAQQIPKKEVNPDIKKQFIAPPGMIFFSCDYSQAELRIMAHLSGDETLLEAFSKGWDPHLAIACQKYGEDYETILPMYKDETHPRYKEWKVKRKQAKQIVFGCIYGIEAKKLATQLSDPKAGLKYTPQQAQKFLDEFFEEHPKVRKFMQRQTKRMIKNGFVTTLFGRRRRCPSIYSENYGEYLEATRQCVDVNTEALTKHGWKKYFELSVGDEILTKNPHTTELEWQPIRKLNIYPDFKGDIYSIEGKTFSALTTGEHRWLVNKDSKGKHQPMYKTTKELYESNHIYPIHRTGEYRGKKELDLSLQMLKLIGIILTDGTVRYYNTPNKARNGRPWYVMIYQSKPYNLATIRDLLDSLGYSNIIKGNKINGVTRWRLPKAFAEFIHGIIPHKKLSPEFLSKLNRAQLEALRDGILMGDGCKHGTRIICKPEDVDALQMLNVLCGDYSNSYTRDSRGKHYFKHNSQQEYVETKSISSLVTIGKGKHYHTRSTRGKNHITKLNDEKLLVWCPTVDNTNWVCRRNNTTYITGNSFNAPCQSAASDMALFASILIHTEQRHGNLPFIPEVSTVHDSIYFYSWPELINPWTVYQFYKICKDPDTKSWFGFEIDDVSMDMDFTLGLTMVDDLPYAPGYDYRRMLEPDFNTDDYFAYQNTVKHIAIEDYPREFPEYFTDKFVTKFKKQYTKLFINN